MTVLVLERYPVELRTGDGCAALLQEMILAMREQPGLLWADGARAFDDDPSFIVLSEWRTAADADNWEAAAASGSYAERLDVYLRGEVTRRRFGS